MAAGPRAERIADGNVEMPSGSIRLSVKVLLLSSELTDILDETV